MLNDTAVTAAIQIEITIMRGGPSLPVARVDRPSASIAPSKTSTEDAMIITTCKANASHMVALAVSRLGELAACPAAS